MEAEVAKKGEQILELAGGDNKKYDELEDAERDINELKSYITNLELDTQGEKLIKRTIQSLWDKSLNYF